MYTHIHTHKNRESARESERARERGGEREGVPASWRGVAFSQHQIHTHTHNTHTHTHTHTHRVYLHLGVAANNTKFKIETTAWNEASFRVPDERGWEPASQPIYPEDGKVSLN